jgi:hypothetical protein
MALGDAALLFGGNLEAFAPEPADDETNATALDLGPAMTCGLLPWHGGAFAILLQNPPAGSFVVHGPRGPLPLLAQTRLLRPDGHATLLVLGGSMPPAREGALVLFIDGEDGRSRSPLRTMPAAVDRTLATLIGQALARTEASADERRNWQPLTRHLATVSELAVRADLSLPIGAGIALVLDGDAGTTVEEPIAFALDGAVFRATRARLAADPQTGRTIIVLPALAARCFVMLDDGLVDITCPPGATRSTIGRAPSAMPLRSSEGELMLDLVGELGLDLGPRVPDWLPVPHALGWRGADGGSIAVVGAVSVEAGTVLFLAADNRDHDLANLTVRDVDHGGQPLFPAAQPIAAFHPDVERNPGRLHLVALLPRRLGAGALHISLAGTSDGGGWIRTLDAAAAQTQSILRAWLPPPPAEDAYLRLVATSVRTTTSKAPIVVVAENLPDAARSAATVALIVGLDAQAEAIEGSWRSLATALQHSIPVVIVLRSADPGFDRIMDRLTTTARADDIEIGILVLAGPAGAAAAIGTAFARLQAGALVVVEAGARIAKTGEGGDFLHPAGARGGDAVTLAGRDEETACALIPRAVAERWLAVADGRLTGVPAVIGDIARVAAEFGEDVLRRADVEIETDPLRRTAFESLVDRAILAARRPAAAHPNPRPPAAHPNRRPRAAHRGTA